MSITATSEGLRGKVQKIKYEWTLTTTGTTSGETAYHYNGEVIRMVAQNVTSSGTIALKDGDGLDMLLGAGLLTSGTSCYILPTTDALNNRIPESAIHNSKITLEITPNTTNASGICYVYVGQK